MGAESCHHHRWVSMVFVCFWVEPKNLPYWTLPGVSIHYINVSLTTPLINLNRRERSSCFVGFIKRSSVRQCNQNRWLSELQITRSNKPSTVCSWMNCLCLTLCSLSTRKTTAGSSPWFHFCKNYCQCFSHNNLVIWFINQSNFNWRSRSDDLDMSLCNLGRLFL
jgi:hypothetical protein